METVGTILANVIAIAIDIALIVLFMRLWPLLLIFGLMLVACAVIGAAVSMGVDVLLADTPIHSQATHIAGTLCAAASVIAAGYMTIKIFV